MKELFSKQFWQEAKKTFEDAKAEPAAGVTRRVASAGLAGAALAAGQAKAADPSNARLFTFTAGSSGYWTIANVRVVTGEALPAAEKLSVTPGPVTAISGSFQWALMGVTSNLRYTTAAEKSSLVAKQADLGRPAATRGALIPIRKNAAWWALSQDDRRKIFEETSRYTTKGMRYLPEIARRLHHCRDLAETQPFDFLTYFDFAPTHAQAFEDLVGELRATEEWKFVDREVDIRLVRA